MMRTVTLTLTVDADDLDHATSIAEGAADHLLETFNDDGSIREIEWTAHALKPPTNRSPVP